jgi:flavin reductase (DIM6/NTAB) family NADH-FMN oxidoreductase RutF
MVEFVPPLIACIVSNRNYSFATLKSTRECVIAIPALEMASKVVRIGNCSGRNVAKFEKIGLTPVPAELVAPPLIGECIANLECRVADAALMSRYNLFILEVIKGWINPAQRDCRTIHHCGYGRFVVDGKAIRLKSRKK